MFAPENADGGEEKMSRAFRGSPANRSGQRSKIVPSRERR
jgi:hypothetical protein